LVLLQFKKIFLIHNVAAQEEIAESRVKFHSFFMPLLTLFWDEKQTIIKKCIKKANFFCGYPLSCGLIHIHAWRHIKAMQRSGEYVSCSRHQCLLIIYCTYFHVTPVSCIYFSFFSLDMYVYLQQHPRLFPYQQELTRLSMLNENRMKCCKTRSRKTKGK